MIGLAIALQVVSPLALPGAVDTSNLATKTEMAAIASTVPPPCEIIPRMDTLTGAVGTGTPCAPRVDSARPTVIQAKTTVTLADATYTITFDKPFDTTPIYADARVYGAAQPYLCTVVTLTTTTASGKCFQLVATTLPVLSTSLLGLVISPFNSAAAGLSVRVVARQ